MNIKMLVMDVDGTLTDGRIYVGNQGEIMKAFDVKDGYAIAHILPEYGILPVIITGRKSEIIEKRAAELHITELYQGQSDKVSVFQNVLNKYGLSAEQAAYIGDDIPDIACMKLCGVTACPADAVDEVKAISQYICKHSGGNGAVREFIEWLLHN